MSQFFERNKKKGFLALLLLLLKRGKSIGPLLFLVALLGFVFVLPSGYHENIPWLERFAAKTGLGRLWGVRRNPDFRGFEEALSSERRENRPGLLPPLPSMKYYGRSTVSYVQRSPSADKPDPMGDNVAASGGKSVEGVLRPEDAKKMPEGVALKEEELHNALLNNNALGKDQGAAPGPGIVGSPMKGKADDKGANMVHNAVNNSPPPGVGSSGGKGAAGGKLDWKKFLGMSAGISAAVDSVKNSNRTTPMYQLAQGRAYSLAAAPSGAGGYCDPNKGCPNEFASNVSGVPFDGKKKPGGIVSGAPEFGDPEVPLTPDVGPIGTLTDQANQLEKDSKQCELADQQYGPDERTHMNNIKKLSCRLGDGLKSDGTPDPDCADVPTHLNCNQGGCGGNLDECKKVGNQIREECKKFNIVAQNHADACPLSGGQANTHDCKAYPDY